MNPLYDQFFNPQYANVDYLRQLQWQQRDAEQRWEITNIVKAIHDYFDAARKIAPEFQNEAFFQCVVAALEAARPTSEMAPKTPIMIASNTIPVMVAKTYFINSFIIVLSFLFDFISLSRNIFVIYFFIRRTHFS